ncbi:MAG: GxxExxY protein [Deltaproteobacteria bacterium]|nr:GxxExxY protein [Deltaproteobacteria bacterium]
MEGLTARIIGAAIEVHQTLGPGLLESAYEECLAHEMHLRGLAFMRQVPLLKNGVRRLVLNYDETSASSASRR